MKWVFLLGVVCPLSARNCWRRTLVTGEWPALSCPLLPLLLARTKPVKAVKVVVPCAIPAHEGTRLLPGDVDVAAYGTPHRLRWWLLLRSGFVTLEGVARRRATRRFPQRPAADGGRQ